jgi:hypothetical protein
MKSIALFILFFGTVLIIKTYYENKYKNMDHPKTLIKYVPITQYEETLTPNEQLDEFYKSIFETSQPLIYDAKKI